MQIQRITSCNQQELNRIADLHFEVLKESTFRHFGKNFLRIIYNTIIYDPKNLFLVLKEKNNIYGFAAATTDINKFYSQIVRDNFFSLSLEVIKTTIYYPKLLFNTIQWLLTKPTNQKYPAELQFIAIDQKFQGQGWGTKLIRELDKNFRSSGINQYKVGAWADNNRSNNFYNKIGFKFLYKENILGKKFNYYLSPKIF